MKVHEYISILEKFDPELELCYTVNGEIERCGDYQILESGPTEVMIRPLSYGGYDGHKVPKENWSNTDLDSESGYWSGPSIKALCVGGG